MEGSLYDISAAFHTGNKGNCGAGRYADRAIRERVSRRTGVIHAGKEGADILNVDCRDDVINKLIMWASEHGISPSESKYDLYMILNNVEITSRCTEVAELKEDRNEMLLKKFLVAKNVKGCTPRTIRYYRISIKKILEQIGKTVDDITTDDIRYYMALRLRRDKVSRVTLGNEIRNLSSFFQWLYAEEIIRRNPMNKVDRIKIQKTSKEAFTEMEIEKLRSAAEGEKNKMIIELLLSTGCRVSELVQIQISEIEEDRILVHGKGQKDRFVYMNAKAQLAVENYLKERKDRNPYLLPRMIPVTSKLGKNIEQKRMKDWWKKPELIDEGHADKGTVEVITRRLAQKTGIERANPHKFRRTCATMALRRGMPIEQVSKMLGHEEISTTQIYLDLTEDELALAHKKYVN